MTHTWINGRDGYMYVCMYVCIDIDIYLYSKNPEMVTVSVGGLLKC
jgi:hypothetical protein